jgi:hypothetical protein
LDPEAIMSRLVVFAALALTLGPTGAGPQDHPAFAGKWEVVHEQREGQPAFGYEFMATQTSASLIVDWKYLAPEPFTPGIVVPSRGLVAHPVESVFPFDDSETNVRQIIYDGGILRIFDTAAWNGDKLVMLTRWRPSLPNGLTQRRTMWLDLDGTLVVESSELTNQPNGPPAEVARRESRYRRQVGG